LPRFTSLGQANNPICDEGSTKTEFYVDIFDHVIQREPEIARRLRGAPFIQGMDSSAPAYDFSGLGTGFSLSGLSENIRRASCASNEVTFTGRVFIQVSESDGPLVEVAYGAGLEKGLVVYLLVMDAAADEIVFAYK
jgi:hypothetical protein